MASRSVADERASSAVESESNDRVYFKVQRPNGAPLEYGLRTRHTDVVFTRSGPQLTADSTPRKSRRRRRKGRMRAFGVSVRTLR